MGANLCCHGHQGVIPERKNLGLRYQQRRVKVIAPMWRNGRRNRLKIAVLAISVLCFVDQIKRSLPEEIA
jgi:hypothetical protein